MTSSKAALAGRASDAKNGERLGSPGPARCQYATDHGDNPVAAMTFAHLTSALLEQGLRMSSDLFSDIKKVSQGPWCPCLHLSDCSHQMDDHKDPWRTVG